MKMKSNENSEDILMHYRIAFRYIKYINVLIISQQKNGNFRTRNVKNVRSVHTHATIVILIPLTCHCCRTNNG